ncbi:hypothetical protein ACP4OV_011653 [Aristida adscensionis]
MRASAPNASRSPLDISANTTPAGAQETEAVPVLDLALFTYSATIMVGILAGIKGLLDSWATVYKVLYIAMAVVTVASTAIGFMTAGCLAAPTMVRNRMLSAWCAKFGSVVATALLVVAIACTIGRSGCVAGAIAGAVIAAAMAVVWVLSGPAAASPAVSGFWDRLRRRREEPESPPAPQPAPAISSRWWRREEPESPPAPQPAPAISSRWWRREEPESPPAPAISSRWWRREEPESPQAPQPAPAISSRWWRREEPLSPQPTTTAPAAAMDRRWYHRLRR